MKSFRVGLFVSLFALTAVLKVANAQTPQTAAPSDKEVSIVDQKVDVSPEKLELAKKLVILTGMKLQYESMQNEYVSAIWASGQKDPQVTPVLEQILVMLKPEFDLLVDQMVVTTAKVFASKIADDKLKEIITFFESKDGQIYVSSQPEVLKDLVKGLNDWIRVSNTYLDTRMRAELTKQGIFVALPSSDEKVSNEKNTSNGADPKDSSNKKNAVKPTEQHVAAAKDMVIHSGMMRSYESILSQIVLTLRDRFLRDPAFNEIRNTIEVVDSLIVALNPEINKLMDTMTDKTAYVFAQRLPEDKIKAIDAFFVSDAGKVFVEEQPKVLDMLMPEVEMWSVKTGEYVNVRTRAELARKGFYFK